MEHAKQFKVTIGVNVMEEGGRRALVRDEEKTFVVWLPLSSTGTVQSLRDKAISVANAEYSTELSKRMETDLALSEKLEGREWFISSKLRKILPVIERRKNERIEKV